MFHANKSLAKILQTAKHSARVNSIETVICLILLLMAVPDLCRKYGRPALANAIFVLFGIGLGLMVQKDVATMIIEAGKVGFLLVLFEVGLEIDLPRLQEFLKPLRFALLWILIQYPLILLLGMMAGLEVPAALLSAAALTGCSMSMAYFGWKNYPGLSAEASAFILQIMVALEMVAMVVLAVGGLAVERGFGWGIIFRLAGMAVAIFLISRFATHVAKTFQWVVAKTTQWRVHFIVLLVLLICALGEHLGLAAAKTAFFLGLFMSRAHFGNVGIEQIIAPISRLLIPIFFVSLGLMVKWQMIFSVIGLLALLGAFVLIGFRDLIHYYWLKTGGDRKAYLLLCPNLTMVALAATSLTEINQPAASLWVLLTGVFMTMLALLLQPRAPEKENPFPENVPPRVESENPFAENTAPTTG